MKPTTVAELVQAYPEIFVRGETSIKIGPGWVPILSKMAEEMRVVGQCQVSAVERRYSYMRVYSLLGSLNDSATDRIVAQAEDSASLVCSNCGGPRPDPFTRKGEPPTTTCNSCQTA